MGEVNLGYQVLARRWRPQSFSEVIGQGHISKALSSAVTQGKVAHAYLFSGGRGVGKTTIARILAKAVNCSKRQEGEPCNHCTTCREIGEGRSVNVVEIDGASNTGVDDIRELREQIKYLPMSGEYKVYIIDEVHMLSNSAFNALLKTLEEPPPHLVFIFATTEVHKIPPTILSRCQHFAFRRISRGEIAQRLTDIAERESFPLAERSAALIAKASEGSMRDGLSILDQALAFGGGKVDEEDLVVLLGRVSENTLLDLSLSLRDQDADRVLGNLRQIVDRGYDLRQFCVDWLEHLRHLTVLKMTSSDAVIQADLAVEDLQELRSEAGRFDLDLLQRYFHLFSTTLEEVKMGVAPQWVIEMAFLKALRLPQLVPLEEVVSALERLEKRLSEGVTRLSQRSISEPTREGKEGKEGEGDKRRESGKDQDVKKTERMDFHQPPGSENMATIIRPSAHGDPQESQWEEILRRIKEKRPNLGSYLEHGVLVKMEKEGITIGYPEASAFLIQLVCKEDHLRLVNDLLAAYYGYPVPFRVVPLPPESGSAISYTQELKQKAEAEALDHPLVKETLRVFGGRVTEIQGEP